VAGPARALEPHASRAAALKAEAAIKRLPKQEKEH